MLSIHTEHIGNMAVIECEGLIANTEAAAKLGEAVTSEIDAEAVVLDLTETSGVTNRALKMLVFLQRWARAHDIELKLFGPSRPVRDKLMGASLEVASMPEMMALLAGAEAQEQKFTPAWASVEPPLRATAI